MRTVGRKNGGVWGANILAVTIVVCTATLSKALDTSTYDNTQTLDPDFLLYWKVDKALGSIRFGIKAKTSGYVGLGLSEVGAMIGSDMMVGTVQSGTALVLDYFTYSKDASTGVLPDSQQNVKTISGEESVDENGETWTWLEFSRALNTGDSNDRVIKEGSNSIVWAIGSTDSLTYHGSRKGSAQLAFFGSTPNTLVSTDHKRFNIKAPEFKVPAEDTTYARNMKEARFLEDKQDSSNQNTGSTSFTTGTTKSKSNSRLRNAHGIMNALGWGIIIPLGAILARYFKGNDPVWFIAHVSIQTSGFLLGLVGFASGVILHNRSYDVYGSHLALAITILVLSFFQIVGTLARSPKESDDRWLWETLHHWAGRIIIILCIVQVYVGLRILKPGSGWVVAYSIILATLLMAVAVLEVQRLFRRQRETAIDKKFGTGGPTPQPHQKL